MEFQIEHPLFLLLFIPVIAALFFYWKSVSLQSKLEKRTIMILRFFVFSLMIIALSSPYLSFSVDGVTTVFVVDQSESVRNEKDNMYSTLEKAIEGMGVDDSYAIVTVGEDGQVSQSISNREKGIVSNTVHENSNYTNLEAGLQIASSLLSTNHNGRIVLLTDGNENIGDVKRQVTLLKDQEILVDVIPFMTSVSKDVVLENFHVPTHLFLGENTSINVTISSTIDTNTRIRISKNNDIIIDEEVAVKQGTNVYSFNYLVNSTGIHSFQVELSAEEDSILENNVGHAIANVKGTPSVLIVEGREGEARNIATVFKASGLNVDIISPKLLPSALTGLLDYETIIFNNVSGTDVTEQQMEIIESAVRDFGVGFIMTGGNQSFGLGGYFKTPIETILPVDMDLKGKKELPSLGLIFVLDRSGSMAGYKMDLAKEAAARSVELLRDKDTLGFIAFDDQPWQIIETGPLDDKEDAVEKISSIIEGGGTNIFPALQLAYEQLQKLDLKRKHIILLTDGHSPANYDFYGLIEEGLESNITLSTVAIGSDADRLLLESLAMEGTGRFYDVHDASTIPSILSRETILTTRTYIEDNPFYPSIIQGTEWSPIFTEGVPQMNVYVATDPKSRAEEILVSDKGDPVLIRWQYGLGHTIAWTSDVSGEWAGSWPAWEMWPVLWNEMLSWSIPSYEQELYHIRQTANGKEITLHVTSETIDLLPLEARVIDEKGNEIETQIRPTAPGEHAVTFLADTGVYFLQLSKLEDNQIVSTYQTGIVVPYSNEFKLTNSNNTLLNEIIEISGGIVIENPEDAFRELDNKASERQPIFAHILLISFLLFFVEIAFRRFGIMSVIEKMKRKRDKSLNNQVDKKEKIEKTFTQLRKASTKERMKPVRKDVVTKPKAKPISQEIKRREEKQKKQPEVKQESAEDRMKRLLDAKNRKNR